MDNPQKRIVITGIGLVAPNADNIKDFREKLLQGESNIQEIDLRYFGKAPAGLCSFPETRYRKKKENKRGSRVVWVFIAPMRQSGMPIFLLIIMINPGSASISA